MGNKIGDTGAILDLNIKTLCSIIVFNFFSKGPVQFDDYPGHMGTPMQVRAAYYAYATFIAS